MNHEKAIQIASKALNESNKELPNIDEETEENRDTVYIVKNLKKILICGNLKKKIIKKINN